MATSSLETGLFENAAERPRRQFIARLAGHRDPPGLDRVLELAVPAAALHAVPTVLSKQPQDLANFHPPEDSRRSSARKAPDPGKSCPPFGTTPPRSPPAP